MDSGDDSDSWCDVMPLMEKWQPDMSVMGNSDGGDS